MRFLDHTWIWDWCRENGYDLLAGEALVAPRLADDSTLEHRERIAHAAAGDASASREMALRLTRALGPWDECLAWATDWDVWEDKENWPRYYAWRAQYGEKRSASAAPGHLFSATDGRSLVEFIAHVIECGWDVTLLPARSGRPTGVRAHTSHDEWVELRASAPFDFNPPAV
jgi:hypothetical protein